MLLTRLARPTTRVLHRLSSTSATQPRPSGVAAALLAAKDPNFTMAPTIHSEFALNDRVGLISGANRGLGLEMAMSLAEAGARTIYCVDLPPHPGAEFHAVSAALRTMRLSGKLEYVSADVTQQETMWSLGKQIGEKEGRMDFCVAAAGILREHTDCLEYPRGQMEDVMRVNVNGVLYTAQAAGREMERFGKGGSIVLVASMSGSLTNRVGPGIFGSSSWTGLLMQIFGSRDMRGFRITRRKARCCRWGGVWRVSWVRRI